MQIPKREERDKEQRSNTVYIWEVTWVTPSHSTGPSSELREAVVGWGHALMLTGWGRRVSHFREPLQVFCFGLWFCEGWGL